MATNQIFKRGDVICYSHHSDKFISQVIEDKETQVQVVPIFDIILDMELPYTTLLTKKENMHDIVVLGNHPLPGDIIREHYAEYLI